MTGKLTKNEHSGTRSADDNPLGKAFQKLFSAEDLHSAMRKFDAAVRSHNLAPIEVAIRWIAHHSALSDDDGVILGASKTDQIRETVMMIRKGPLPKEILRTTDELWDAVKESRAEII